MLEIKVVGGFINYKVCYQTCAREVLIFKLHRRLKTYSVVGCFTANITS